MLELKRPEESNAKGYHSQVKNLLWESSAVRAHKCKNLGEVTSKTEFCTGLAELFKLHDMQGASFVLLWHKAYRGTQTAASRSSAKAAECREGPYYMDSLSP